MERDRCWSHPRRGAEVLVYFELGADHLYCPEGIWKISHRNDRIDPQERNPVHVYPRLPAGTILTESHVRALGSGDPPPWCDSLACPVVTVGTVGNMMAIIQ